LLVEMVKEHIQLIAQVMVMVDSSQHKALQVLQIVSLLLLIT